MAPLTILAHPDTRLRTPCAPLTAFDADLARLVADLLDTLKAAGGIGLSAPQVGDLRRVSVMDLAGDRTAPEVFVNPEIVARRRWGIVEESCLSVPGVVGNVLRATRVLVRAADPAGEPFERELEDMHAVCLQHEVDHLNGKLFIERLSPIRRLRLRLEDARARRRAAAAERQAGRRPA
ncbi:MAG: peptide deformylase [Alphaproteobacteria bacterium]|jgi:peptide deformylase|nr:peptide deformylase [Alphaproteobacteria bacterium]